MDSRRLYYATRANVYPAYLIDTFLALTGFDEWDFSSIESWPGPISGLELVQILNPDLIVKMETRIKIAKTKKCSDSDYLHLSKEYSQKVLR
jgi:hypothetical protein